jgi:hypothetical protein
MSRTSEPSTVEQLVDGLRAKMAGQLSSEPCTESALDAAEQALGFKLPAIFRRLYGTLGYGVWPGTLTLAEIVHTSEGRAASSDPWPKGCIDFYAWGCGIGSCIDLRSKRARVVRFDPHFRDVAAPALEDPFDATRIPAYAPFLTRGSPLLFRRESDSLEDWFAAWLEGHSASDLQGMAPQAARRLEREAERAKPKARSRAR